MLYFQSFFVFTLRLERINAFVAMQNMKVQYVFVSWSKLVLWNHSILYWKVWKGQFSFIKKKNEKQIYAYF
jgi:hypothetical protein